MEQATENLSLEGHPSRVDPTVEQDTQFAIRISPQSRRLRLYILVTLAILLLLLLIDSLTEQRVKSASVGFITWVEYHPFRGVLAVVIVYILATILFVPASILTVGTGFAFRSAFDSIGKGVAMASTVRSFSSVTHVPGRRYLPYSLVFSFITALGRLYWR
jgi:hypothetical protein